MFRNNLLRKLKNIVKRFIPSYIVLMYHRISEEVDPYAISVSPRNFKDHIEVIKEFEVCKLSDISERIPCDIPDKKTRKIVITFDDGYQDIIPGVRELVKENIPATIFIPTGFIGKSFWWDELKDMFLYSDFTKLEVDFGDGEKYKFKVKGDISQGFVINPSQKQKIPPGKHTMGKEELFSWLYYKLKYEKANIREKVMSEMKEQIKWWRFSHRSSSYVMNEDEIVHLRNIGVDIGAHTVTHEVLSSLPRVQQEKEIKGSKRELEELINSEVFAFSYPFGFKEDFTKESVEIVKESGFKYACTGIKGQLFCFSLLKDGIRFRIPRFSVLDWDKDTFRKKLWEFFSV